MMADQARGMLLMTHTPIVLKIFEGTEEVRRRASPEALNPTFLFWFFVYLEVHG